MKTNFTRSLLPLLFLSLSVVACSSPSSGAPSNGNGSGGDILCATIKAYLDRCPDDTRSMCTTATLADCRQYNFFSASASKAVTPCFEEAACAPDPLRNDQLEECAESTIFALAPSEAQKQIATDYCASCGDGTESCATNFFVNGEGKILEFNDDVAHEVDATCAKVKVDGGSCAFAFDVCVDTVIRGPEAPCDGGN